MDAQLTEPIAVAKPVRGREMRTTEIRVPATSVKDSGLTGSQQKLRDKDVEVYHEGYINGKLYLVPDSNLRTMRDIVNFNMKRRYISVPKLEISTDEPSQYNEFKSKFDSLLEKVDKLAEYSDESISSKYEALEGKEYLNTRRASYQNILYPKSLIKNKDTITKSNSAIPPILDESIKYKRVRAEKSSKEANNVSFTNLSSLKSGSPSFAEGEENFRIKQENEITRNVFKIENNKQVSSKYDLSKITHLDYNDENATTQPNKEVFRLLVSGHLKKNMTPIFVINQDYTGSNVLENEIPDFKTHKKEGNIEICITGKFFTEDILVDKTSDSPAVINMKSHQIIIDSKNYVQMEKFKNIYNVGTVDISLEGEFIRDTLTSKYTPQFSLDIIKPSSETIHYNPSTTILFSEQTQPTPFEAQQLNRDNRFGGKKLGRAEDSDGPFKKQDKHVHYEEVNTTKIQECYTDETVHITVSKRKSVIENMKQNRVYKMFFHRNRKEDLVSEIKSDYKDYITKHQGATRNRREKKAHRRRQSKRRQSKYKKNRIQDTTEDNFPLKRPTVTMYQASEESKTFPPSKIHPTENLSVEEKNGKASINVVKKKKDKNQAIVENPILAQMQEFFLG